jgi:peptidoglycan/LPS O-acetylase OafA/YrhL
MQNQPKHDIIRPLTGLRGLTITWVVVYHFRAGISILAPALNPLVLLTQQVRFRVDLLFLLSGFLLTYVYIRRHEQLDFKSYREFLWARLIRFYPAYLTALLVLMFEVGLCRLLKFPIHFEHYRLQVLPFRLALLQAWPFFSEITICWNVPTWFLSALWFGYLFAVPGIWKLFPKLRASRFTLLWVFTPILVYVLLSRFAVLREFYAVLQACCEMVSGGALCAIYVERKPIVAAMQRHLDKIVLLLLVPFVAVLWISSALATQIVNWLLLLACPILLAGLTAERSRTARLLATRPFLWIGNISYSLFVSHAVVLMPLARLLPPERFAGSPVSLRCAVLAVYVFAVLSAAVALYKLVEIPCARMLKQLSTKRSLGPCGKSAPVPQEASYSP